MRAGDLFFLYTDGVTEATDPEGNQFGERRNLDLLAEPTGTHAGGWVAGRVRRGVQVFERGVAIGRRNVPGAGRLKRA